MTEYGMPHLMQHLRVAATAKELLSRTSDYFDAAEGSSEEAVAEDRMFALMHEAASGAEDAGLLLLMLTALISESVEVGVVDAWFDSQLQSAVVSGFTGRPTK